jgi:hypothetical protein
MDLKTCYVSKTLLNVKTYSFYTSIAVKTFTLASLTLKQTPTSVNKFHPSFKTKPILYQQSKLRQNKIQTFCSVLPSNMFLQKEKSKSKLTLLRSLN